MQHPFDGAEMQANVLTLRVLYELRRLLLSLPWFSRTSPRSPNQTSIPAIAATPQARASVARCAAGRQARAISGLVLADTAGTPSIQGAFVHRASINGPKLSASAAIAGHRIRIGMSTPVENSPDRRSKNPPPKVLPSGDRSSFQSPLSSSQEVPSERTGAVKAALVLRDEVEP